MHISSLFRQLKSVGDTSSRRGKDNVLRAIASPTIKSLLSYAYDNTKVFGIKPEIYNGRVWVGDYVPSIGERELQFDELTKLLEDLMARRLVGYAARTAIYELLRGTTAETHLLVARILLKDLDIGIGVPTINEVWQGLIPVCTMQLAKDFSSKHAKWPMWGEVKYDGKRSGWLIGPELLEAFSRNGKAIAGYDHIRKALDLYTKMAASSNLPERLMIDGELMWGMFGERVEANAILRVYDIMSLEEWHAQKCGKRQRERSHEVQAFCSIFSTVERPAILPTEGRLLYSLVEAEAFYAEVVAKGGEGIMLKDPTALYGFKRDHRWMKMKPALDVDLMVVDTFEGEGKYEGMLGGVVVDHKGKKVRCGAGFSDAQRHAFWNQYSGGPDYLVGQTVELRYTEVTPDGSLRFPRFVRLRDDK